MQIQTYISEGTQKYHNHEAQPSRGTKRTRCEEQTMTIQTTQNSHWHTNKEQRRNTTHKTPWKGQYKTTGTRDGGGGGLAVAVGEGSAKFQID